MKEKDDSCGYVKQGISHKKWKMKVDNKISRSDGVIYIYMYFLLTIVNFNDLNSRKILSIKFPDYEVAIKKNH